MIAPRAKPTRTPKPARPALETLEGRELLTSGVPALAQAAAPQYGLVDTIQVPGQPLTQFDISYVDSATHRLYFADRANGGIDIIDTRTNTFLSRVGGFAGPAKDAAALHGGPQGVVAVGHNEIWATDGDSTVKVIRLNADRTAGTIVDSISTGGQARGDEIAYDPRDHLVVTINNDDTPPYATLISTNPHNRHIIAKIAFPNATGGLEQPVYDPQTRMIYVSVPQLNGDPATSAIAKINPKTHAVSFFPLNGVVPSGLVLGPHQELATTNNGDGIKAGFPSQTVILSARDGHVIAQIPQVGGSDEIWYNPGDHHYYIAARDQPGGGVLGIVDARTHTFIQSIPTSKGSKSVAADSHTNRIYVPVPPNPNTPQFPKGGINVYAAVKP